MFSFGPHVTNEFDHASRGIDSELSPKMYGAATAVVNAIKTKPSTTASQIIK